MKCGTVTKCLHMKCLSGNRCNMACLLLSECDKMSCQADNCTMICEHSKCHLMTCGKDVKYCEMHCLAGSNCNMKCEAKTCKYFGCGTDNKCKIIRGTSAGNTQSISSLNVLSYSMTISLIFYI